MVLVSCVFVASFRFLRASCEELLVQRCLLYCSAAHFEKRSLCVALEGWRMRFQAARSRRLHASVLSKIAPDSPNDCSLMIRRKAARICR